MTNLPHLYKSEGMENGKHGISSWKWYRKKIPKTPKPWKVKNYTLQKVSLSYDLADLERDFSKRYNPNELAKRDEYNIDPEVYVEMTTFAIIWEESAFLNTFWLTLVTVDPWLQLYIFRQTIENYHLLEAAISDFINSGEWESPTYNLIKLISNIRILNESDRTHEYMKYFDDEVNIKSYIVVDPSIDIRIAFASISSICWINLESIPTTKPNEIVIEEWLFGTTQLNKLISLCDFILEVKTENYLLSSEIDSNSPTSSYYPQIEALDTPLTQIIWIVDTWIEKDQNLLDDFIEKSWALRYSFDWTDALKDSKSINWHWTWVASIVVYWEQLLERKAVVTPTCKVCSIKVIDYDWNDNELIEGIVEAIKLAHIRSEKKVRIFNLSLWTRIWIKSNSISDFAKKLDRLMYQYDILCIIAAGNIDGSGPFSAYPRQWCMSLSNLSSPAESLSGLTVGSIWYFTPTHWKDRISPYSRKDHYFIPKFFHKDKNRLRYRRKPDIVLYWWDIQNKHHVMVWNAGTTVEQSGTSFATPYATHIAWLVSSNYPDLSMTSIKAIVISIADEPSKWEIDYYDSFGIEARKVYWHWVIKWQTDINKWIYSNEDSVTVVIEDSIDFSQYSPQKYPFNTLNIKLPRFSHSARHYVKMTVTLCYNPFVVDEINSISSYNPCFIAFWLHNWSDNFWTGATRWISKLTKNINRIHRWSDIDYADNIWNNTQKESFLFSKKDYNEMADADGIQITLRSKLKDIPEYIDFYKANPQKFSLVVRFEDLDHEDILYEGLKALNSLKLANEITATAMATIS